MNNSSYEAVANMRSPIDAAIIVAFFAREPYEAKQARTVVCVCVYTCVIEKFLDKIGGIKSFIE